MFSIEFYVIAVIVAACIIAVAARPASRGEARTILLAGELAETGEKEPAVEFTAMDDGTVELRRYGLPPVTSAAIAITVIGWDISIKERLIPAGEYDFDLRPADTASFRLDFMAPERYHIKYTSDATSQFLATPFHNRPDYRVRKKLST